jgi:hypothetical protein
MSQHPDPPVRLAPWRARPWLDPLEDFQVLPNAPEIEHATTQIEGRPDEHTVRARASITFADGAEAIKAVGEGPARTRHDAMPLRTL